jgi:hypothetical protein
MSGTARTRRQLAIRNHDAEMAAFKKLQFDGKQKHAFLHVPMFVYLRDRKGWFPNGP